MTTANCMLFMSDIFYNVICPVNHWTNYVPVVELNIAFYYIHYSYHV